MLVENGFKINSNPFRYLVEPTLTGDVSMQ